MSSKQNGKWWSFTQNGNVGIWTVEDWEKLFQEGIQEAEEHYKKTVKREDIKATILEIESIESLGSEMQSHIKEDWSQLAKSGEIDRSAYITDSVTGMAIKANVDASEATLETFESFDKALEWAQDA